MKIRNIDFGKIDANNEFLDKGDDRYLESSSTIMISTIYRNL